MHTLRDIEEIKQAVQAVERKEGESLLEWMQSSCNVFAEKLKEKNLIFDLRLYPREIQWSIKDGKSSLRIDSKNAEMVFSEIISFSNSQNQSYQTVKNRWDGDSAGLAPAEINLQTEGVSLEEISGELAKLFLERSLSIKLTGCI